MQTTATALTSILLALALTGTAVGTLSEFELREQPVPTGGMAGQAIGCTLSNGDWMVGYGKPGVPSSTGTGDGECEFVGNEEHTGDVTHSALRVTADYGWTGAIGIDWSTGEFASHFIHCGDMASLLVDWTTEEPQVTYLVGGDCTVRLSGTADISELEWVAPGGGSGGNVKFVHTDNYLDALVHLLV